jgi:diguanylate cyclase (GGDEF)-like protein
MSRFYKDSDEYPHRIITKNVGTQIRKIKTLRKRLSAALEWSAVDKGLIILVLILPIFFQYLIWSIYVLSRQDRDRLVNVLVVIDVMKIEIAFITLGIFILLLGLFLRKKNPKSILFQTLALHFFSLSLVAMSYSIGTASFCAGLVLLGAPVFGFILLDRKAVWGATMTALIVLMGLSYITAYGLLPYAPVMITPMDQVSRLFWMNSVFFFAAPFFIPIILMADQMLMWWREREEKIRYMSRTDALTNIHNRFSILSILDVEVARSMRIREPLSVVILDLDHFKRVNDQWGHPTGDLVLKTAAEVLRQNIREVDSLGRYGGEEFIIILPNSEQNEAQKIIERCRTALAQTNILSESKVLINVTASFGVVNVIQSVEQNIESYSLIKTADEALYIAKNNGRNRIETKIFVPI